MTDSYYRTSLPSHPLHIDVTKTGPSYFESEDTKSIAADSSTRLKQMHSTFEEARLQNLADLASNPKEFCAQPSMFSSSSGKEETLKILQPRPFADVKREWELKRAKKEQCHSENWIELEPAYIDIQGCLTLVFSPKVTVRNCNSFTERMSDNEIEDFNDNCCHLSSTLNDRDDVSNSSTSPSIARGDNIRREDSIDKIHCSKLPSLFPYHLGRYHDHSGLLMWRESSVYYF